MQAPPNDLVLRFNYRQIKKKINFAEETNNKCKHLWQRTNHKISAFHVFFFQKENFCNFNKIKMKSCGKPVLDAHTFLIETIFLSFRDALNYLFLDIHSNKSFAQKNKMIIGSTDVFFLFAY